MEPPKTITVFSTFPRVECIELPQQIRHVSMLDSSYVDLLRAYLSNRGEARCFLFNGLSRKVWLVSLLKTIAPNKNRKLVVVDLILAVPSTLKERLIAFARRSLLSRASLFISYAKNNAGLQEVYGLPEARFRYVPFKVNNPDVIATLRPEDDEYILVAGQTRRDFETFRRAIEGLAIPVRIVAPDQGVLFRHGSQLSTDGWPDEVRFVRDALKPEEFLPHVARARLVVLPIVRENITPSGIGVCLVAMALRKCVIVSSGPAADGLVDDGQAIVVEAGDSNALRDAIVSAWNDSHLRSTIAQRGFDYATSLGDENRLHRDMFDEIERLFRDAPL